MANNETYKCRVKNCQLCSMREHAEVVRLLVEARKYLHPVHPSHRDYDKLETLRKFIDANASIKALGVK